MNPTSVPSSTFTAAHAATVRGFRTHIEPLLRQPWFLCAMVVLVALMSTYVHVINGQVERGERLRAQGLAQVGKSGKAAATQLLAQAAQQPLATVSMDTGR